MNYELQVVKGRSAAATLRLLDGVTSLGRHDDCAIRIRSSQVSRRHCEFYEKNGQLILRDLGSSNGTYVNGKRVMGQQPLQPGDVLTIGGISLRVSLLGQGATPAGADAGSAVKGKPGDTAVVEAIPIQAEEDEEEFEIEFDDDEAQQPVEVIPLAEDDLVEAILLDEDGDTRNQPAGDQASAPEAIQEANPSSPAPAKPPEPEAKPESPAEPETTPAVAEEAGGMGEDAVADFLMDLKLDDED